MSDKLYMPEKRSFHDFFSRFEKYPSGHNPKMPFASPKSKGGMQIGPYCIVTDCRVSPSKRLASLAVYPSGDLIAFVNANMITIDRDHLHFEVIIFDHFARVIIKHGQIIGSRWLSEIDPSTIPLVA